MIINKARAREHFSLGLEAYFDGDRKAAVKHGNLAVAQNVRWSRPHWLLGLVHSVMPPIDIEEAIREYRELVRKEPRWSGGHFCLGNSLAKQGRVHAAIPVLREAVRLEPARVCYRTELARLLLKQRDYREAITVLRGRPSLSPFYTIADAYLMLAETLEKTPSISDRALEVWQQIMTFDESIPANRPAMAEARKRLETAV